MEGNRMLTRKELGKASSIALSIDMPRDYAKELITSHLSALDRIADLQDSFDMCWANLKKSEHNLALAVDGLEKMANYNLHIGLMPILAEETLQQIKEGKDD
jgi:hypothetical protein